MLAPVTFPMRAATSCLLAFNVRIIARRDRIPVMPLASFTQGTILLWEEEREKMGGSMLELEGKSAIVTGGSRGYGTGIAEALKQRGVEVWVTGRDAGALQVVADKLGVQSMRADVSNSKDWDRIVDEVVERHGRVDILVNNAGGGIRIAPLQEQSDAEIEESVMVNLTGAILGCRRVVPLMTRQKSGTIINISSVCAREAWQGWSVYSAAKAGLVQFSRCLYTEVREFGVRVTSLIPSWGATNFLKAANLQEFDPDTASRAIQPGDLGDMVVTICSLPSHLVIEDLVLWPLVQKVEPL
jgi:NAD(P)-dependent dehydrogenase (short-subunit alcohol dehydrogenase family)